MLFRLVILILMTAGILVLPGQFDHGVHAQEVCPNDRWHAPGCGHEHGDNAPGWALDWLASLGLPREIHFGTENTTGPHENMEKHNAFKGYYAPTGFASFNKKEPVEIYVLMHASSNPGDRQASVHSASLYVKDAAGNVSFRQGWMKLGTVKLSTACQAPRLPTCETPEISNSQRPIVLAPTDAGLAGNRSQETWYGDSSFDISWGVSDATTKLTPGEQLTYDPATWFPTGFSGLIRTLDVTWQTTAQTARGWQVRDQFGTDVISVSPTPALDDLRGLSGLSDPRCGQPITYPGGSGSRVCLPQYIAPTSDGVVTAGGARRTFPSPPGGVRLPN